MNEIKKCPFCGMNAYAETTVCFGSVRTVIGCVHCGVECEKSAKIKQEENIIKTMNKTFESVLNAWNKRAEEPHKESRVEQILKRTIFPNKPFCTLAYNDKHGKGCKDLDCCECEFNNVTETAKYLLAPYEGKDDFVAVSDLISKTQSSANEILEALRANAKKEK